MSAHLILASENNLELLCARNDQTQYFSLTILKQASMNGRVLVHAETTGLGVPWGNLELDLDKFYCISTLLRSEIENAQKDCEIDLRMSFYPFQMDGYSGFSAIDRDGTFYEDLAADTLRFGMYNESSSQATLDAECVHIFAFDTTGATWFEEACLTDPTRFACVQAMLSNSKDIELPTGRRGREITIGTFRGLTGSFPNERDPQYQRLCFKDPFDLSQIALDNGSDPLSFKALRTEIRDLQNSLQENGIYSFVLSPLLPYIEDLEVYGTDIEVLRNMRLTTVSYRNGRGESALLSPDGLERWDF